MTTQTLDRTVAHTGETSGRTAARWAASGYLAIFVLAIFANFLAFAPVVQPGDATATADALRDSETSFRLGATAFLAIFLVDVVIAWALYALFRPVHRDLSLAAAWFRLTYTVVLGAALAFLFAALWLVDSPTAFGGASDEGILLALQIFDFTWVAGLAAFGVHLLLIAVLLLRAQGPRWIASLMMAAGAAYVADTVAHLVLSDYESYAGVFLAIVGIPSILGELSFTGWLLLVATGRRAEPAASTQQARG
jgi:Domain of unknown function (DUF4386)